MILAAAPPGRCRAETVKQDVPTVGGVLAVVQLDDAAALGERFRVTLGGRQVLETDAEDPSRPFDGFPFPKIIGTYADPSGAFDEIALIEQFGWGNACNGGPLWFLGIARDGRFRALPPIDFCGGPAPRVETAPDGLQLRLPGGPPNRGEGAVPEETWLYRDGAVSKLSP